MLVGAAVLDNYFSKFCYEKSVSGYEFLYTIPGSIGGNIFMNAGCYNQEIKDKLNIIQQEDLIVVLISDAIKNYEEYFEDFSKLTL